jgi:hypothetical protein
MFITAHCSPSSSSSPPPPPPPPSLPPPPPPSISSQPYSSPPSPTHTHQMTITITIHDDQREGVQASHADKTTSSALSVPTRDVIGSTDDQSQTQSTSTITPTSPAPLTQEKPAAEMAVSSARGGPIVATPSTQTAEDKGKGVSDANTSSTNSGDKAIQKGDAGDQLAVSGGGGGKAQHSAATWSRRLFWPHRWLTARLGLPTIMVRTAW